MSRSTVIRIGLSAVVVSMMLVSVACETMDGGYSRRKMPFLPLPYAVSEVVIGVRLERGEDQRTVVSVRPYRALVLVGQRVEWYSLDGPMRLEFREPTLYCPGPRPPVFTPTCPEERRGTYCYLDVPEDTPLGKYPYFVRVTRDGQTYTRNQPVMDIRG